MNAEYHIEAPFAHDYWSQSNCLFEILKLPLCSGSQSIIHESYPKITCFQKMTAQLDGKNVRFGLSPGFCKSHGYAAGASGDGFFRPRRAVDQLMRENSRFLRCPDSSTNSAQGKVSRVIFDAAKSAEEKLPSLPLSVQQKVTEQLKVLRSAGAQYVTAGNYSLCLWQISPQS